MSNEIRFGAPLPCGCPAASCTCVASIDIAAWAEEIRGKVAAAMAVPIDLDDVHQFVEAPPAEGDPLAEMRAYVAQCEASLGRLPPSPEVTVHSKRKAVVDAAREMFAIAERTIGPELRELANWQREFGDDGTALHAAACRDQHQAYVDDLEMRAESAEAALRALVEADSRTDAQALAKAWAEARRRV